MENMAAAEDNNQPIKLNIEDIEKDSLQKLMKFLALFDYKLLTIDCREDTDKYIPLKTEHFNFSHENNKCTLAIPPHELLDSKLLAELHQIQKTYRGIFFTPNEGDGIPITTTNPNNLNVRSNQNIQTLKSLYIDTDKCPIQEVESYLASMGLKYHAKVCSSPGKYHLYFLINPVEKTFLYDNLPASEMWKAVSMAITDELEVDKAASQDYGRLLRLPGFLHQKDINNKHEVSIQVLNDFPKYDLKKLFDVLQADRYLNRGVSTNTYSRVKKEKFKPPTTIIKEGERRQTLTASFESRLGDPDPRTDEEEARLLEQHKNTTRGEIISWLPKKDHESWLYGNDWKDIERYIEDQFKKRIHRVRLNRQAAFSLQLSILESKLGQVEKDFYINCPGLVGDIARELHDYFPPAPVEFKFAAALLVVSSLKTYTYRIHKTFWPSINAIVVGTSSAGKSSIFGMAYQILRDVGFDGLIPEPSTPQYLHTKLYEAGGVGTAVIDEAGDFVAALSDQRAASHHTLALRKYLKQSTTTGYGTRGAYIQLGSSNALSHEVIKTGLLSVWFLIQPSQMQASFSQKDLADGLISRFLIFKGEKGDFDFPDYVEEKGDFILSETTLNKLKALYAKAELPSEFDITCKRDEIRSELLSQKKKVKEDEVNKELAKWLYTTKQEILLRRDNKINLPLSDDSKALIKAFQNQLKDIMVKLFKNDPEDLLIGYHNRLVEHLYRLLCAICDEYSCPTGTIEADLTQKVIDLVLSLVEQFKASDEYQSVTQTPIEAVGSRIMKSLNKIQSQNGGKPVPHAKLYKSITSAMRKEGMFKKAILYLSENNRLKYWDATTETTNSRVIYYTAILSGTDQD